MEFFVAQQLFFHGRVVQNLRLSLSAWGRWAARHSLSHWCCLLVFGLLATTASAQRPAPRKEAVGVGTRLPTEMLHVDGTVRIGTLPLNGEKKTYEGNYQPNTPFAERYVLVANKQGVLGRSRGLPQWVFYMPPILLPLCKETAAPGEYTDESNATTDGLFVVDLYAHYQQQFGMTQTASQVRSNNSVLPDGVVWSKEQLMFFVTYYDNSYFQDVTVSDEGVLRYRVKKNVDPSEQTYMNIVFRVRE